MPRVAPVTAQDTIVNSDDIVQAKVTSIKHRDNSNDMNRVIQFVGCGGESTQGKTVAAFYVNRETHPDMPWK